MLQLRAFVPPEQADAVAARLIAIPGVRHLVLGDLTMGGMTQITGEVDPADADMTLEVLRECDLAADDVTLWRATSVQPLGWRRRRPGTPHDVAVWAEVMGHAQAHSRPNVTYILFMVTAGVIAGVGVLTASSILIVGAMAVSPDLLPMSAAAIGVADRRWNLAGRAWLTLTVGLLISAVAAMLTTWLLRATDRIADDVDPGASTLGLSLTSVGPGSVLVAIAAGVAGMLAYESAGGVAVGVAISVTTIPAAAYVGTALGLGGGDQLGGAIAVLAVNINTIVLAGAATVWTTRYARARWPAS